MGLCALRGRRLQTLNHVQVGIALEIRVKSDITTKITSRFRPLPLGLLFREKGSGRGWGSDT